MRKSQFLAALRREVSGAVDGALAGTGMDSKGCPWIDHWFGYYEGRSAAQIERALRRYAPEAAGAGAARDYIPMVTGRIRRSAETYAKTGEIGGLPDDVPESAIAGEGVLGSFGGMFFKGRPGGPRPESPVSVRDSLGRGRELPGSVRTTMESTFGASFAGVRLHEDARAADLADRMNARAFTVGRHVAFGRGEFRPGTVAGDALIAHELAHVVQQGGGGSPPTESRESIGAGALEADADHSAAAAVWILGAKQANPLETDRRVMPRLRSGLTLSRCKRTDAGDPRLEQIKKVLQQTPTGRDSLTTLERYSVKVSFVKGQGYYYDQDSNTLFLDLDHDIARSALDLAHELNHAKMKKEGTTADKGSLSRADYVQKMLEEEALGTSLSIEAKMELEGTSVDVSGAVFPLEAEYRAAYTAAVNAAKAANPSVSEEEQKRLGKEAGRKRVLLGHKNGEIITSTTNEPYPDYYGKEWDKRHPSPGK